MGGPHDLLTLLLVIAVICDMTSPSLIEPRKGALLIPEKIIEGVIDIVHNHKNKPAQGTYQPVYPTQQQNFQSQQQQQLQQQQGFQTQPYPQYPQYPPNYNNQGYSPQYQGQYQGQYQSQGQYTYPVQSGGSYPQYGATYPQTGGSYPVNTGQYPSGGNYGQGNVGMQTQGQNQGQYQVYPQNPQTGGQYQNQNQFQGQLQGSGGNKPGGSLSGGFQVTGGQQVGSGSHQVGGGGPGPTCVCQAWTKPQQEVYGDEPIPEKPKSIENVDTS